MNVNKIFFSHSHRSSHSINLDLTCARWSCRNRRELKLLLDQCSPIDTHSTHKVLKIIPRNSPQNYKYLSRSIYIAPPNRIRFDACIFRSEWNSIVGCEVNEARKRSSKSKNIVFRDQSPTATWLWASKRKCLNLSTLFHTALCGGWNEANNQQEEEK